MRKSDLVELRALPKVFPRHPYARQTAGLGAGESATAASVSSTSGVFNVKVIGIYCTRRPTTDPATQKEEGEGGGIRKKMRNERQEKEEQQEEVAVSASELVNGQHGDEAQGSSRKRHIYVRVQFDKALVDTLPLEVMREKYPQVLIDYLLSTAVWT